MTSGHDHILLTKTVAEICETPQAMAKKVPQGNVQEQLQIAK